MTYNWYTADIYSRYTLSWCLNIRKQVNETQAMNDLSAA